MEYAPLISLIIPFIVLTLAVIIYFLPTFVVLFNNPDNWAAVFLLNLFLGWTFVGWVVALVVAVWRKTP